MHPRISHELAKQHQRDAIERGARARTGRRAVRIGVALAVIVPALAIPAAADAAVVADYSPTGQILTVFGDSLDNQVTVSRDAAGKLLVNSGAVAINGGTATVANTALIQVFGQGGNDTAALDERSGALPRANLFGGANNDTLTGGSGGDMLFGQAGNDSLTSRGGNDFLFGGAENDTLTGGDADDFASLEAGNDRFVWNPGDDTDTIEDSEGTDTVEFNGGNGAEQLHAIANGTRVSFKREAPAPMALDIAGTVENLVVNANGGDDAFRTTGNLAALTRLTVDGGPGADTLFGGNGADVLLGGDGADVVDPNQGDDVAFLGAGDDRFGWNPGDGSDVIEGQDGADRLDFDGSGASERFAVSDNGGRVRFTRDVANIVLDLDGVEQLSPALMGGEDRLEIGDLGATDLTGVAADLAGLRGATTGDERTDQLIVRGTAGADAVQVAGPAGAFATTGLPTKVEVRGGEATDGLHVIGRGGDDKLDASTLAASAGRMTLQGDHGADTLLGGAGADVMLGGEGNDGADGGQGNDVALLGDGRDRFAWGPGDGSDSVDGDAGTDTLGFTGSNIGETITLSANGGRARLDRNVGLVTMDLGGVEKTEVAALGGADTLKVEDLSGTRLTIVDARLQAASGTGDAQPDRVVVNGTNGDDRIAAAGGAGTATVTGLAATTRIAGAEPTDTLEIRGLGGDDTLDSSGLQPTIGFSFVQ